ncbi:hypothetical protein DEJ28_01575 [Curtobacterium sp. MCPF17_002]|uniref:hypothetical protein n=1 Tax=Curtobacterium sp. MCPF17_002 TaxID=2175645 RepID=UPI000DA9FF57|nr:hypothetical protein [Curtobacterium sp. MCPF17_002]WIB77812.1 hypothetical protein DEJ28_01575 [Curtobacterium sp. MCPF17_002]
MNSEPPIGDDLQRMLVSMKQNVLKRAESRRHRGRRTGIVIAVIALLAVGTAGGGVALGLIPTSPTAAPESSPSATREPTSAVTPSSAPVVDAPTPVLTPTPTVTAPPYSAADWSTWTISADAVGPATLGSLTGADDAALRAGFAPAPPRVDDKGAVIYPYGCPNPNARIWDGPGGENVVEIVAGDAVGSVIIGQENGPPGQLVGPRTFDGIGLGSTLDEVKAAYPDLVQTRKDPVGGTRDTFWAVHSGERYIVFQVPYEGDRVATVYVGSTSEPEDDYCS